MTKASIPFGTAVECIIQQSAYKLEARHKQNGEAAIEVSGKKIIQIWLRNNSTYFESGSERPFHSDRLWTLRGVHATSDGKRLLLAGKLPRGITLLHGLGFGKESPGRDQNEPSLLQLMFGRSSFSQPWDNYWVPSARSTFSIRFIVLFTPKNRQDHHRWVRFVSIVQDEGTARALGPPGWGHSVTAAPRCI